MNTQHTALQSLLSRFQELYERTPVMILILDGAHEIIDCNRRALMGLGRPPHQVIGQPFAELVAEEGRPALRDRLAALADGTAPADQAIELTLLTGGGPLVTSATFSLLRARDGTPLEVHVIMLDISEVTRLRQRVHEADRLASVGQLAAGVAHEINNPAAFVLANLNYLEGRLPLLLRLLHGPPEPTTELFSLLKELPELLTQSLAGMRRIRDIVRDLQIFARPDSGREPLEWLDLNRVCDTVANMAWPEVRRRARLEKCYGAVPQVFGHPGKLSQVLLNLMLNAAQAIPEGDQARNKIVLSTAPAGQGVQIEVRDTGCGIPRPLLSRVFDPFFTTKPPGQGTGLGLSISYEIIRGHGGRIEVESEVGAGTTFRVFLPIGVAKIVPTEAAPAQSVPAVPSPRSPASAPKTASLPSSARNPENPLPLGEGGRRKGKVLLVDDEPALLRALERMLRGAHEVLLANSGREALSLLSVHRDVDVIVCDLMMPETSGMELFAQAPAPLRERFVFLSGDTASEGARAFLESARAPHLCKPVEPAELKQTIAEAVEKRHGSPLP